MIMCGGGGDSSKEMRKQQADQERRIEEGLRQINAIFGGGTFTPHKAASTYVPGQKYLVQGKYGELAPFDEASIQVPEAYLQVPAEFDKGMLNQYERAMRDRLVAEQKQKYINEMIGNNRMWLYQEGQPTTYEGFTPAFFGERQRAYEQYQLPFATREFQNAQNQLAYKLGNQGLLNSSVARGLGGSLQQELAKQRGAIATGGLSLVQDLQKQLGQERATVTQQLVSSANPQLASAQALEAASRASAPSPVAPVSNLFGNWMNMYLANDLARSYNKYNQDYNNQVGIGLAANPAPSRTVT